MYAFPLPEATPIERFLSRTAETTHLMSFEMGKVYHKVIVGQRRANDVILQVEGVLDRNPDFPSPSIMSTGAIAAKPWSMHTCRWSSVR